VASHAVAVQNRLDIALEVRHVRQVFERLDDRGRTLQGKRRSRVAAGLGGAGARLVAADTGKGLAGHQVRKALHALDRKVVGIERDEEERAAGRREKRGTAVLLDRHGAQNPFQVEGARPRGEIHATAEVDGFGQRFEHEQLLDVTAFDAFHVASLVDVEQHELSVGRAGGHARRNDRLARPRTQHARLVDRRGRIGQDRLLFAVARQERD